MAEQDNRAAQLQQKLLDDNGFRISREELMELFVTENMHNKEKDSTEPSASFRLLQKYGFRPGIVSALKANAQTGLDNDDDIALRRKIYGKNARHQRKIRSICDMICEVFQDFILKVLIVAAIVSTTLGCVQHGVAEGFQEGAGIMFAIIIIVVVTVGNDYAKEKKFQELMSQADVKTITVKRNGELSTIDSEQLVVGDIVTIGYGQAVPADCLVITSAECFTSEAALTGEPDDLPKEPVDEGNPKGDPFMLQGSEVQKGEAEAIVLAVGDNTNQGRAGLSMNIEAEETPLQMKLNSIAEGIGKLGLTVAILTLIAIITTTLVKTAKDPESDFGVDFWKDIATGFVIAITVIVVAIPEGLPLAVTISLAFSVAQMQKENNLVRKLQSSETMGNANEICTDKTGTLTQNKMTVQAAYLETQGRGAADQDMFNRLVSSADIADATIMNTTAFYQFQKDADGNPTDVEVGSGNVTELGLLDYLRDSGVDVKAQIAVRTEMKPVMKVPLNSERKRSTIVFQKGEGFRIYCKGAPEVVINYCTDMVYAGGECGELTDEAKGELLATQKNYANQALRTLLVTYRDVSADEWDAMKDAEDREQQVESGLTAVAMFGLKDPLRPGIADAVTKCKHAGINVRMVTGDNIDTARAISLEAGILTQEDLNVDADGAGYVCMTGEDFRNTIDGRVEVKKVLKEKTEDDSDDEDKYETKVEAIIGDMHKFKKIAAKIKVMARSQPDDKFMLVDGLIRTGQTVAVTGDGTNDAPALNRADVGFAMGITGTDVAKSACDIQLLDDNFCSILTAVRFGRNIYDNVRKFLQFQLTVNVVAMFIVFCGACIFAEPPLTSTQMLWVNLIMDTFAALALATEPPSDTVLDRQPAKKSDLIVNAVMWRNILLQALYQMVWLLLLLFLGKEWFDIQYDFSDPTYPTDEQYQKRVDAGLNNDPKTAWIKGEPTNKVQMYTIIFQSFVFLQLFNQINSRKLGEREFNVFSKFFNNWMFLFITVLTFGIQVVITQKAGRFMSVVPLTVEQNLWCLAIGASCMIYSVFTKFVPARWFAWIRLEEREQSSAEDPQNFLSTIKRQRTQGSKAALSSKRMSTRKIVDDDNYALN